MTIANSIIFGLHLAWTLTLRINLNKIQAISKIGAYESWVFHFFYKNCKNIWVHGRSLPKFLVNMAKFIKIVASLFLKKGLNALPRCWVVSNVDKFEVNIVLSKIGKCNCDQTSHIKFHIKSIIVSTYDLNIL